MYNSYYKVIKKNVRFIIEIIKLMRWQLVEWITYLHNETGDQKYTSGTPN